MSAIPDAGDKLLARSVRDKKSGCRVWTGALTGNGYGNLRVDGVNWYTHRLAYCLWVDVIPKATVVHHKCGNRACIEPTHLQAITPQENLAEMFERNDYIKRIAELEGRVARCTCEGRAA